jgi:hypothetical protein
MLATSLLLLALSTVASSDVAVTVTDPSGGRIPGATVSINPDSPAAITTVTGERGEAVISGVAAGEHRVRVNIQGFEPWEKKVKVRDGRATVEAKLKLAKLAEDVSVTPRRFGLSLPRIQDHSHRGGPRQSAR